MKVVITGALGHIGSCLLNSFPVSHPDSEIVLVDNLATQRYTSLFNLKPIANYRFIEGDLLALDLAPIFEGATVVHLAAATDAANSFKNRKVVESNFELTRKVAEACIEAGSAMIFPSTTSVYGTQKERVDEDCSAGELKPQSPYAETKLREEKLLRSLGECRNLRYVSCRFGTIFGTSPGMRFHTAVNKFCWQAAMKQPITVWRTAYEQKRPYLDIVDACRAVEFLIERAVFDRRTVNVVTVNATVGDIVEIIRALVDDLSVELTDSRIMNQLSYEVDSQRIQDLGFQYTGDLYRGIHDTISLLTPRAQ